MAETRVYRVPEMSCAHCERAITEGIQAVAGVSTVVVDLEAKRVTVTGESLDDGALKAAIVDVGYAVA